MSKSEIRNKSEILNLKFTTESRSTQREKGCNRRWTQINADEERLNAEDAEPRRESAKCQRPIACYLLLAACYYLLNCQRAKRRNISSPRAIVANCNENSRSRNGHPESKGECGVWKGER